MNSSFKTMTEPAAGLDETPEAQLALLRSRVETELGRPSVILVTSAHDGDGNALTAHSLANAFITAGRRAALVSASLHPAPARDHRVIDLSDRAGKPVQLDWMTAFVKRMRSEYDFTIIEAGAYPKSNIAMALGAVVDGILLAVRLGRAPTDEDELMVQTIANSGGRIVGVVATSGESIEEFETKMNGEPAALQRHYELEAPAALTRKLAAVAGPET